MNDASNSKGLLPSLQQAPQPMDEQVDELVDEVTAKGRKAQTPPHNGSEAQQLDDLLMCKNSQKDDSAGAAA